MASFQPDTNALKDRPQNLALRLREPCLTAEADDIAIRFPVIQLPCINHLLPFSEKKMQAKFVAAHGSCGLSQQFADDLAAANRRLADVSLVRPETDGVERVNINP